MIAENLLQIGKCHFVEGSSITQASQLCTNLTQERLHELCNRHTRRNAVRIDDDIWNEATRRLRHILCIKNHAHSTLLTVTTRELVTNLRNAVLTDTHLGETIALSIAIAEDAIHIAYFIIAHCATHIAVLLCSCRNDHPRGNTKRNNLANQNVLIAHKDILRNKAIGCKFCVICVFHLLRQGGIRAIKALLLP